MRFQESRLACAVLVLGAVVSLAAGAPLREEVGSASTVVPVDRAGSGGSPARPSQPPPVEDGRVVGVRLVRVIPLLGNNPFNPREPILNRDGRIISSLDGDLPIIGGDPSTAGASCVGATATFAGSPTAPPGIFFAGINVNPNTGACGVVSGGGGGHALIFQSPPDQSDPFREPDPASYSYFVDGEGIWTQIEPPRGVWADVRMPGVPQTVTIRATTGLTVRIQFTVTGTAGNHQLQVDSITRL